MLGIALRDEALVPAIVPASSDLAYAQKVTQAEIDELVTAGLLVATFYKRRLTCPQCGSDHVLVSECCAGCGSGDIAGIPLIYHLTCAAVFPQTTRSRTLEACPKCAAQVDLTSGEFEICGEATSCNACGHQVPESVTMLECQYCRWSGDAAAAVPRRLASFVPTELARRIMQARAS